MSVGIMDPCHRGSTGKTYTNFDTGTAGSDEHAAAIAAERAGRNGAGFLHSVHTRGQSVHIPKVYKRLGRLAKGHARALEMAKFIDSRHKVHAKRAGKLRTCGAWLVFNEYLETGNLKLSKGMFCQQHLLCPLCAQLRAGRTVAKYFERVGLVLQNSKLSMLTLTIKNGPDLKERFEHLVKAVNRLMGQARRARNGSRHRSEFTKFRGGVMSIESKRGEGSKEWHVHAHALCIQDSKIDLGALAEEWKTYTKDSCNIDLRLVKGDPVAGFCEVFKYAMKFSDLSLEDNWKAFGVLAGKRLLRPWGALWGVKVPETLTDDLSNELGPYVERFFRYRHPLKAYTYTATRNL